MKLYENCPALEGKNFLLRLTERQDCDDLLVVYSDKNALPFFNSDNCHGDNFYYQTKERMEQTLSFWEFSYQNGYFARLSILEKREGVAVGTVELCRRASDDAFDGAGILRVDVRSDYEEEAPLLEIFSLVVPPMYALLDCDTIITKAPIYAVERIKAVQRAGFSRTEQLLIGGQDGYAYNGYWVVRK